MKRELSHRERVLAAINHIEPDRVPLALWGSAYGVTDPLYFDLAKLLGLDGLVAPFRRRMGHTVNYYDERILDALDIDVRYVDCGFTDLGGPPRGGGVDSWGVRYGQAAMYLSPVGHPLEKASAADLEDYPWPAVERYVRLEESVARARFLREKTDYAVVGRACDSYGPFERCCTLRGTQNFLMDLSLNEEFVHQLVGKVTSVLCRLLELYMEAVGGYLDVIELPGDDYAAAHPIISPAMFERFFVPAWREMIGVVKGIAPRCKILFHSDGNMGPLLNQVADLGVDIFHPVEPLPTVDMTTVKRTHGSRLCLWGGIDLKQALQGDEARVVAEVKERLRVLAPGGGYVLAPSNHLQPDVPAGNVVALFKAARLYGQYPIQGVE